MKLARKVTAKFAVCLTFALTAAAVFQRSDAQDSELTFTRDIRPILSDKCFSCHGNDEDTREAGLRLDIREEAIDMEAIVPGSAEESTAYQRMISDDEDEIMPPPRAHKTLTNKEIELIRVWIEEGAQYEQHWAYRPLSEPQIDLATKDQSPIDAMIAEKHDSQNLKLAKRASPETLVRRLFLDLTGLPPTITDVDAFSSDPSEEAYEKLVDKLLNDKAYGERMAVFWLDLVRYADTVGYHADNFMEVSAYRDYVIDSFNNNKPFDQFTIEQLAGDLLPNATVEQKIASGYNRLLQTTEEGGAQAKEYIAIYAADRVRNVSGVWMGQTMGCAQCHDHKYDPITMKDFYAMSAFFADIKERAVGKRVKNLQIFTPEEQSKIDSIKQKLAELEKEEIDFKNGSAARKQEQQAWEASIAAANKDAFEWHVPNLFEVSVSEGEKLDRLIDGSYLSTGKLLPKSNYRFKLKPTQNVTSIRVEALTHESFPIADGLSRGNGNFVLTEFEVYQGEKQLKIANAKADFSQNDYPAANTIDDNDNSGWAVNGRDEKLGRQVILFTLENPLEFGSNSDNVIEIRMNHESMYKHHNIGRFRLSLSPKTGDAATFNGPTAPPENVGRALQIAASNRSDSEQDSINEWFLLQSSEMAELNRRRLKLKSELKKTTDNARTMLIAETSKPRMTKILDRGNWMDDSGEEVVPAVPEFLSSKIEVGDRRLNRLDLANWIVEPSNPLTSRTFVNRLWNVFFGRGISNNLDDLGGQGEPPSHPELLDYLAAEFQQGDWNVKRIVKMIVMSDTYRQSSVTSKSETDLDPSNRWYARQGRWRIDAEFVRDSALQLSGLLRSNQVGGRSVKPYQPKDYWQHLNFPKRKWQPDNGDKLYRRSLYTFWCRSFLHPTMVAFDAPTREECIAKRARSNIPQQALVRLNDPIFIEASRGFAQRIMQFEGETKQKISKAWQEAVNRKPMAEEIELLLQLLDSQTKRYADSMEDAKALVTVGDSPLPEGTDVQQLAAWTQVARAMLNAYETISRH